LHHSNLSSRPTYSTAHAIGATSRFSGAAAKRDEALAFSDLPLIVATGGAISVTAVIAIRAAIAAKFGFRFYGQIYVDHPQTAYLDLVPQVVLLKHLIDASKYFLMGLS
jgi:hypothetical protein